MSVPCPFPQTPGLAALMAASRSHVGPRPVPRPVPCPRPSLQGGVRAPQAGMCSACGFNWQCSTGNCGPNWVCYDENNQGANGCVCVVDADCQSGYCLNLQCAPPAPRADLCEICVFNEDCASGNCGPRWVCYDEDNRGADGCVCAFDSDCQSGRCAMDFRCAPLVEDGGRCVFHDDCESGFCDLTDGWYFVCVPTDDSCSDSLQLPFMVTNVKLTSEGDEYFWGYASDGHEEEFKFLKNIRYCPVYRGGHRIYGELISPTEFTSEVAAFIASSPTYDSVLYNIHGFNVDPESSFMGVHDFDRDHGADMRTLGIPINWRNLGFPLGLPLHDRHESAPRAGRQLAAAFPALVDPAVPASLMCHSMGNYVMRVMAQNLAEPVTAFADLFMVAADARMDMFATAFNPGAPGAPVVESMGASIPVSATISAIPDFRPDFFDVPDIPDVPDVPDVPDFPDIPLPGIPDSELQEDGGYAITLIAGHVHVVYNLGDVALLAREAIQVDWGGDYEGNDSHRRKALGKYGAEAEALTTLPYFTDRVTYHDISAIIEGIGMEHSYQWFPPAVELYNSYKTQLSPSSVQRIPPTDISPMSSVPQVPIPFSNDDLYVPRGQLTFDAEGNDDPGSELFSRVLHWTGGDAGVTLGRGYDLCSPVVKETGVVCGRKWSKTRQHLRDAGFSDQQIKSLRDARDLHGQDASEFVEDNEDWGTISYEEQKLLFTATYEEEEMEVQHISNKTNMVVKFGEVYFDTVPQPVLDIVVDLHFRGDYKPTRHRVQPLLASGCLEQLANVMADENFWIEKHGVPPERFELRKTYIADAAAAAAGTETGQCRPLCCESKKCDEDCECAECEGSPEQCTCDSGNMFSVVWCASAGLQSEKIEECYATPATSVGPSDSPSGVLSILPSAAPGVDHSAVPSFGQSAVPSVDHSVAPSFDHSAAPSFVRSAAPSVEHSSAPSMDYSAPPSMDNSAVASFDHSAGPSTDHSVTPSSDHSPAPSFGHSAAPSFDHSAAPSFNQSTDPSVDHSAAPSVDHSTAPSVDHSTAPSFDHSAAPNLDPSAFPSFDGSAAPSSDHGTTPSVDHSTIPSVDHSAAPSFVHSATPSFGGSAAPTFAHSATPSVDHSGAPSFYHSVAPSSVHSTAPSFRHSTTPSVEQSAAPSFDHSTTPSVKHSAAPSFVHSAVPSVDHSSTPSMDHSASPSVDSSAAPSDSSSTTVSPIDERGYPVWLGHNKMPPLWMKRRIHEEGLPTSLVWRFELNNQVGGSQTTNLFEANATHVKIPQNVQLLAGYSMSNPMIQEHETGIVSLIFFSNPISVVTPYAHSAAAEKYHTLTYEGPMDESHKSRVTEETTARYAVENLLAETGQWFRTYLQALAASRSNMNGMIIESMQDTKQLDQLRAHHQQLLTGDAPSKTIMNSDMSMEAASAIQLAKTHSSLKSMNHCTHLEKRDDLGATDTHLEIPLNSPIIFLKGAVEFIPAHYIGLNAGFLEVHYDVETNVLEVHFEMYQSGRLYPYEPSSPKNGVWMSSFDDANPVVDSDDGRSFEHYKQDPNYSFALNILFKQYLAIPRDYFIFDRSDTCEQEIADSMSPLWDDVHVDADADFFNQFAANVAVFRLGTDGVTCGSSYFKGSPYDGMVDMDILTFFVWVHFIVKQEDPKREEMCTATWWNNWDEFYKSN